MWVAGCTVLVWSFLLSKLVYSSYDSRTLAEHSRSGAAKADVATLAGFITSYQARHENRLPSSLEELIHQNVITEAMATDPWGNHYKFISPAKRATARYDLYSEGPNPTDSSDNIGNWDAET